MKSQMRSILAVLILLGFSQLVAARTMSQTAFETELFGLSELSHFGIDKARYEALTSAQRDGLLRARAAVLDLLKELQRTDGQPLRFLTDSLKRKYPTKQAFASSLLEVETSLIGVLVTDFLVSADGKNVELSFTAILSSEGMIVTGSKKAVLVREGKSWRVAQIL